MPETVLIGLAASSENQPPANASFDNVSITGVPDFVLSGLPLSNSTTSGGTLTYTLSLTALGGFTGAATLTVTGLPAGVSSSFSPAAILGGQSSSLTIATSTSTPIGTYPFTVTATNGSLVHSVSLSLVINSADFTLTSPPSSQTVAPGGSVNYVLSVTPLGAFSGPVTFGIPGLPPGVGAALNPQWITTPGNAPVPLT